MQSHDWRTNREYRAIGLVLFAPAVLLLELIRSAGTPDVSKRKTAQVGVLVVGVSWLMFGLMTASGPISVLCANLYMFLCVFLAHPQLQGAPSNQIWYMTARVASVLAAGNFALGACSSVASYMGNGAPGHDMWLLADAFAVLPVALLMGVSRVDLWMFSGADEAQCSIERESTERRPHWLLFSSVLVIGILMRVSAGFEV